MNLGIAGTGAIGRSLASFICEGTIEGVRLAGICGIDNRQAGTLAKDLGISLLDLPELLQKADCIVEATSVSAMPAIVREAIRAGKIVIPMSVGGFVADPALIDIVSAGPGIALLPSGGITGIDGLLALREIGLDSVEITTTKSPQSLSGAPFFASSGNSVNLDSLHAPTLVFSGSALEAIQSFPANTNLAITVSLSGIGLDRTRINIVADPAVTRTKQHLKATAGGCVLETSIQGLPLPENPKTSLVALQSVKALLRKEFSRIRPGT